MNLIYICIKDFATVCEITHFYLESYYLSNVTFIDSIDHRLPCNKVFYSNTFFDNIKSNRDSNKNYYYFEITTKFDIFIYNYNFEMELRPIDNVNISEWTLLNEKTKVCKGAPMHLRSKMSHTHYVEVMKLANNRVHEIEFNIIKNDKGNTKMLPQKKVVLNVRKKCVSYNNRELGDC